MAVFIFVSDASLYACDCLIIGALAYRHVRAWSQRKDRWRSPGHGARLTLLALAHILHTRMGVG